MYLYPFILLVFAVIVAIIATKSQMLRNEVFSVDNYLQLASANNITKPKPSYSLARTQLAFWTVIIVSSYIYSLMFNSSSTSIVVPLLPAFNLTLLGIAAGTTMVAKVIDNSQQDNTGATIPQQDWPSKGFFTDIISDANGVSIHRLQNVLWTIIVGGIYVAFVYVNYKLPDSTTISTNLLALMGISASTYLGLKTTENNAASAPAAVVVQPLAPVIVVPQAQPNAPAPAPADAANPAQA
jgi:hypothetical protein